MSYCSLGFRLTADGRQGGEHAEGEGGGKSLSFCLLFRLGGGAAFIPKLTTYSLPYYVLVHPMADPERTGARHEVRGRGRGDPSRQEAIRRASARARRMRRWTCHSAVGRGRARRGAGSCRACAGTVPTGYVRVVEGRATQGLDASGVGVVSRREGRGPGDTGT